MPAKITRSSMLTGKVRTLQVEAYEQDDFDNRLNAWKNGKVLIQDAFPDLSASAREFILTGMTDDEWDSEFGGEDA